MKTILIPTDFTAASLQVIEEAIHFFKPEPIDIVLFHAFTMPASMQDIATSADKPHLQVMNEFFRKGCKRIKDRHQQHVHNICFRYMYGETKAVFRQYLAFNKIDQIVYPSGFFLQTVHARSVHPGKLIKSCGTQVIHSTMPAFIFNKTAGRQNAEYLVESTRISSVHQTN
jgi:hypothetical protein